MRIEESRGRDEKEEEEEEEEEAKATYWLLNIDIIDTRCHNIFPLLPSFYRP